MATWPHCLGLWTVTHGGKPRQRKSVHLMKVRRQKEMGEAAPAYPHSLASNGWHLLA